MGAATRPPYAAAVSPRPHLGAAVNAYLGDRVGRWRTGSRSGQRFALSVLLGCVAVCFAISLYDYETMPLTTYFVWLLLGMLVLRFRPLVVLSAAASGAGVVAILVNGPTTPAQVSALVALAVSVALILLQSSRQRSGLPGLVSEAVLVDLRDRLQSQGTVPPLPAGWTAESAMIAAYGIDYAGDFLVAELSDDERHLEMILVDVCGKGVGAGTQALQFAGALGGLLGALPPTALMSAANDFLLRTGDDETFATAVHVTVDLTTGAYGIVSAGHPPALRYDAAAGGWQVDHARGTALGIAHRPELVTTAGVLAPGEGLLFYTDGVIESRDADIDVGLDWLRRTADREVDPALGGGFGGLPARLLRQVTRGDDDRAVLVVSRSA